MNSESLRDIEKYEAEKAKLTANEDKIIDLGLTMDDFMRHPGWRKLVDELSNFKNQLLAELASPSVSDNLNKIKTRQHLIMAIDLFMQTPKKFVLNKSNILNRRKQCQKP